MKKVIANFMAKPTDNTESLEVLVEEHIDDMMNTRFRVYVNGGVLGDGVDEMWTSYLPEALGRAAGEVMHALEGT